MLETVITIPKTNLDTQKKGVPLLREQWEKEKRNRQAASHCVIIPEKRVEMKDTGVENHSHCEANTESSAPGQLLWKPQVGISAQVETWGPFEAEALETTQGHFPINQDAHLQSAG